MGTGEEMRLSQDAPVAKRSGSPTSKARSFRAAKVARGCAIRLGERSARTAKQPQGPAPVRQRPVVSNSCFQKSEDSAANYADAPFCRRENTADAAIISLFGGLGLFPKGIHLFESHVLEVASTSLGAGLDGTEATREL